MAMKTLIAWVTVGLGAVVGVISSASAEQPGGTYNGFDSAAGTIVFLAAPIAVITGLAALVRMSYRRRHETLPTSTFAVRSVVVSGWACVILAAAAVPWVVGGTLGSARLDRMATCEDWCGFGSALLAIFAGMFAVGSAVLGGLLLLFAGRLRRRTSVAADSRRVP